MSADTGNFLVAKQNDIMAKKKVHDQGLNPETETFLTHKLYTLTTRLLQLFFLQEY
jgi:hypothetical protein